MITRRIALLALLALGASAAGCASLPSGSTGTPLRVMTYNIRSGNGNLDSTAAAIRAQSPDIVALQEVDVHWADRSAFADQVSQLAAKLGMEGRFAPIYILPAATPGAPPREFGVALLSRYPIVRFRNDTIARLSTQVQNPVPTPAPGLLDAVLDVHGQPVRVFNTHLDYRQDPAVRTQQVREMLGHIGDLGVPTLVFGDMNASPDAPELQPLLQRLHDAWSGSDSPGFTYPADTPRERIDYVLVSPQFTVRSIRVPDTQASDHRPVVAEVVLGNGGRSEGQKVRRSEGQKVRRSETTPDLLTSRPSDLLPFHPPHPFRSTDRQSIVPLRPTPSGVFASNVTLPVLP